MIEYHNVTVRVSDFQLFKLKSVIKGATPVTLRLSDEANFPDNVWLTDGQVRDTLRRKSSLINEKIVIISFFNAEINRPDSKLSKVHWGHVADHKT